MGIENELTADSAPQASPATPAGKPQAAAKPEPAKKRFTVGDMFVDGRLDLTKIPGFERKADEILKGMRESMDELKRMMPGSSALFDGLYNLMADAFGKNADPTKKVAPGEQGHALVAAQSIAQRMDETFKKIAENPAKENAIEQLTKLVDDSFDFTKAKDAQMQFHKMITDSVTAAADANGGKLNEEAIKKISKQMTDALQPLVDALKPVTAQLQADARQADADAKVGLKPLHDHAQDNNARVSPPYREINSTIRLDLNNVEDLRKLNIEYDGLAHFTVDKDNHKIEASPVGQPALRELLGTPRMKDGKVVLDANGRAIKDLPVLGAQQVEGPDGTIIGYRLHKYGEPNGPGVYVEATGDDRVGGVFIDEISKKLVREQAQQPQLEGPMALNQAQQFQETQQRVGQQVSSLPRLA